jgi:hypothetical protein
MEPAMTSCGPFAHEIHDDILVIRQNGVSDAGAIREGMRRALSDPRLKRGSHLLWDGRSPPAQADPDKMRALLGRRMGEALSERIAMLVDTALQHGVARMFAVYAEDVDVVVQVFHDEPEALAWLRSP